MKHDYRTTIILLTLFLFAQLIGLNIVSQYVNIEETARTGVTVVEEDIYLVPPPQVEDESNSWIFIVFALLFGTALILLLVKYKLHSFWKFWFSFSVFLSLFIALYPYLRKVFTYLSIQQYSLIITAILVIFLTYFKIWNKGFIAHNLTEIFIYGGVAALIVPIVNIKSGIIILIIIAVYDAYAVWKSKHMVKMAQFQSESVFAGLEVPTKFSKQKSGGKSFKKTLVKQSMSSNAILGGGDIAFPLIFAGVVLKTTGSYLFSFFIIIGAFLALSYLLFFGKPDKFYPAMPFISFGCLVGYLFVFLL